MHRAPRQCRADRDDNQPLRAAWRDAELNGGPARSLPPTTPLVSLSSRTLLPLVAALVALPSRAPAQAPRSTPPSAARATLPDAPLPFDTAVQRGVLPNGIHYLVRRN